MRSDVAESTRGNSTRRATEGTENTEQEEIQKLSKKALVSEGWRLDREIKERAERLALVKERLVEAAKGESADGETVELEGSKPEHRVLVAFPEPRALSFYFDRETDEAIAYVNEKKTVLGKLKEICGDDFKKLFFDSWKPKSKTFRDMAVECLGKVTAKKLIAKVFVESTPRVSFK